LPVREHHDAPAPSANLANHLGDPPRRAAWRNVAENPALSPRRAAATASSRQILDFHASKPIDNPL
jgi:hypothetical protein